VAIEMLRRVSESYSAAGKELAAWHAMLNAFQCWSWFGHSMRRSRRQHWMLRPSKAKSNTRRDRRKNTTRDRLTIKKR
jgi:hypothetical protein